MRSTMKVVTYEIVDSEGEHVCTKMGPIDADKKATELARKTGEQHTVKRRQKRF